MSLPPNTPPNIPATPLPYYGQPVDPNRRPTTVSVFAWIAIVWGSLVILSPTCVLASWWMRQQNPQPPNPITDALDSNTIWHVISIVLQIIGWIAGIILLVGGIQSLKLKPAGRKIILGYAYYSLISAMAGIFFTIFIILPALRQQPSTQPSAQILTVMIWGVVAGTCISLIFYIAITWLTHYFLNRPHVKEAFARGAAGGFSLPPTNFGSSSPIPAPPSHIPPPP